MVWATEDAKGRWVVMDGDRHLAGPFDTNADAWRWIDSQDPEAIAHEEQRDRISKAIAKW